MKRGFDVVDGGHGSGEIIAHEVKEHRSGKADRVDPVFIEGVRVTTFRQSEDPGVAGIVRFSIRRQPTRRN